MSRDSGGTYTLPLPPVAASDLVESSWANTTLDDIKTAISDSLSRSGKGGMSAAFKISDGTISAPGIAFTNAASTGVYRAGTDDVRFSVAGADLMRWSTTYGVQVYISAAWVDLVGEAPQDSTYYSRYNGDWVVDPAIAQNTADIADLQAGSGVDDGSITLAKMADVATSTVFYRKTAGTGVPEVQTLATLKTDLGLTGTNSGDQTITLTGDVTGSGTGSFATTIDALKVATGMVQDDAITYAKMQNVVDDERILGRVSGANGVVEELTAAQVLTMIGVEAGATAPAASQVLTAAPADTSVSGLTAQMQVGETVTFGQVLFIHTDGKLWEADADVEAERVVAMAAEGIAADATGNVLLMGFARNDAWTWTVGSPLYNSTTVGDMTHTAPSGASDRVQVLGYATHADRVWFHPSVNWITI